MNLCFSALIVLAMGVINTLMDVFIFGFSIFMFLADIAISILLVLFANWLCNNNWYSLSWFLSIVVALLTLSGVYLYRVKDPVFMKNIEAEKKKKTAVLEKNKKK
jgi:membrane protein implicated in regulation of membrane protease activity